MKNNILSVFLCMSSLSLTLVAADNNTFKPVEKFEELPAYHKGLAGIFIKEYQEEFKDSSFYNKDIKEIVESGFVKFYNDCKTNPSKEIPESSFSALIGSFMNIKNTPQAPVFLDELLICFRNDLEGKFDKKNLTGKGLSGLAKKMYGMILLGIGGGKKHFDSKYLESKGYDATKKYFEDFGNEFKKEWAENFGNRKDLLPESGNDSDYEKFCFITPINAYSNIFYRSSRDWNLLGKLRIQKNLKKHMPAVVKKNVENNDCDEAIITSGAKKLKDITIKVSKPGKLDWMVEKNKN